MTPDDPEKTWVPADWVDEITPPPRATPDAWIVLAADGAPMLAGCHDGPLGDRTPEGGEDTTSFGNPRLLRDGDVVVFMFTRNWGTAVLTVNQDGTWSVDREMPPEATSVWIPGDHETVDGDVAALVENCSLQHEIGDHEIEYFEWSDGDPFVFDAANRRFVAQQPGTP
ncbi:hypothetical protein GXW78_07700 [Roseomonas terrae]|uniref:Uncharacterized protein n=1 Tax=Neoroseomonas terrae TaxID=424799 RepID=A0ABS5EEU0_9PROT|nr:hypothetical protein [Neoroseomonas terrae]MBR0649539.1 hypothetical protein [Neoroseomonas terrae]